MTAKELMMPRYEVIADYPGSTYPVGTIFTSMPNGFVHYMLNDEKHSTNGLNLEKYPYLFRRMNWWEKRSVEDMPKRLKNGITDGIDEIEEWDMKLMIGWVNKKEYIFCDLTWWRPEFGYVPVD